MQHSHPIRHLALSLVLLTAPAAAQSVVHFLPDEGPSVVRAGDFDHDGVGDFAVRSPDGVRVHSGASASVLLFIDTSGMAGNSITGCGDIDHDGTSDLLVGDTFAMLPSGAEVGRAIAYSGGTGTELWTAWGNAQNDAFGFAVSEAGDANADGTPDLIVGAWQYMPPFGSGPGYARLLSGVDGSVLREWIGAFPGASTFGVAVGTIGDLDGDGHDDQLVTELGLNGGVVYAYSGADGSVLKVFDPPVDGSFGMALEGGFDLDADGVNDLVAAAPGWSDWAGRVVALSGADSSLLVDVQGPVPFQTYLGHDVDVLDDMNGDGVPEVLTGGNAWPALPDAQSFALVVSGADSAVLLAVATTSMGSSFNSSTACALGDLDGDGSPEFAIGGTDVVVLSLQTDPPVTYCPAKPNSQGCTPAAAWSGTASLTGPADFQLSCTGMINQMRGALMWSLAASAPPYQGGTLCLAAPWQPAVSFFTGGSPSGVNCSGIANLPLSQALLAGTGALPGETLYAQFFYRDPFHLDGTGLGLSNGVSFSVLP